MPDHIVKSSLLNINSPRLPLMGNLRDNVLSNKDLLNHTCGFLGQQAVLARAVSRDWNRSYSLKQAEVELRESYENMTRAKALFKGPENRFLRATNMRIFLNKIDKKIADNTLRLIGGAGLSFAAGVAFCVMESFHCSNIFPMKCSDAHIYHTGSKSCFLVIGLLAAAYVLPAALSTLSEKYELKLQRSLRDKEISQNMVIEKFQSIKTTFLKLRK